jgi:MFS family permease
MNGLLSNPIFITAIDNPDANKLGIISAAYALGGVPGLFPASFVADRFGRRMAICIGALLIITGGLVQTFTAGGNAMLAGRFVVGLGSSFQGVGGGPYTAEISHPRNRAQTTALINTCQCLKPCIRLTAHHPLPQRRQPSSECRAFLTPSQAGISAPSSPLGLAMAL